MTIQLLQSFFMWCSIINMALLWLSFGLCIKCADWAYKMHSAMFRLTDSQLDTIWYTILGAYKIAIFMFNVVPYIALRIMTG